MKILATAIVNAMAFLELSGESVLEPDAAVAAMEMLCADLRRATPAELAALREAVESCIRDREGRDAPPEELEFFRNFFANAGLE